MAGRVFGHILEGGFERLSLQYLRDFAWACAPHVLEDTKASDIVVFAQHKVAKKIYMSKVLLPVVKDKCRPELCRNIEWSGNADLCGIGVSDTRHLINVYSMLNGVLYPRSLHLTGNYHHVLHHSVYIHLHLGEPKRHGVRHTSGTVLQVFQEFLAVLLILQPVYGHRVGCHQLH